jgi:hypothetical protein
MKILNKSQAAFVMSCRELFRKEKHVFFWTFTFPRCMPDWYYPRTWNVFMRAIQDQYGGFLQGLRVCEVHENGHGLHYHALINQRISVYIVRRLWAKYGGGHVQVDTATAESAEYLAKYLTKQNPLWPGMRRWGTIGGFRQVKVKSIVVESAFHRNVFLIGRGRQMREWPEDVLKSFQNRVDNQAKPDKIVGNEWKTASGSNVVTLCNAPF